MKRNIKKAVAAALAMTMCVPATAFAADSTSGSFTTSFDIYSPTLTVEVPVNLNVEVNPFADSTATDTKKFAVASKSIDIINGSVDLENDIGIPVVATIKASITSKGEGVVTEYKSFTADNTSSKKKIYLELTEGTGAKVKVRAADATNNITAGAPAYDNGKLDLAQYELDSANKADYTAASNKKSAITGYGSLLSLDIAKPVSADTGSSYADATDVTPQVGSFAVTGVANTNADWKQTDIGVTVTYDIKASNALSITTPAIATAPTFANGSNTDLSVVIPDVGEATVTAVALHNDGEKAYGDFIFAEDSYTVAYAPNATTTTKTDATIKIPKDHDALTFLAGDDYKNKAQDFVVALSDGRFVVSTLTVTKTN